MNLIKEWTAAWTLFKIKYKVIEPVISDNLVPDQLESTHYSAPEIGLLIGDLHAQLTQVKELHTLTVNQNDNVVHQVKDVLTVSVSNRIGQFIEEFDFSKIGFLERDSFSIHAIVLALKKLRVVHSEFESNGVNYPIGVIVGNDDTVYMLQYGDFATLKYKGKIERQVLNFGLVFPIEIWPDSKLWLLCMEFKNTYIPHQALATPSSVLYSSEE